MNGAEVSRSRRHERRGGFSKPGQDSIHDMVVTVINRSCMPCAMHLMHLSSTLPFLPFVTANTLILVAISALLITEL